MANIQRRMTNFNSKRQSTFGFVEKNIQIDSLFLASVLNLNAKGFVEVPGWNFVVSLRPEEGKQPWNPRAIINLLIGVVSWGWLLAFCFWGFSTQLYTQELSALLLNHFHPSHPWSLVFTTLYSYFSLLFVGLQKQNTAHSLCRLFFPFAKAWFVSWQQLDM